MHRLERLDIYGPCVGKGFNTVKCVINLCRKFVAKAGTLLVIVVYSFCEFLLSAGDNTDTHCLFIRSNTASAESASSWPASNASILDSDSAAQRASILSSWLLSKL